MSGRAISIRDIDPSKLGPHSPLLALMRRKPRRDLEHQAQVQVFAWAEDNTKKHPELRWLFAVPNGSYKGKAAAGRFKAEGLKSGVPDILLPVARGVFRGLVIEMKASARQPRPEQQEWLDHFKTERWAVLVAYSAESAISAITTYLSGRFE